MIETRKTPYSSLTVHWAVSEEASGRSCCDCGDIIWFNGYAPFYRHECLRQVREGLATGLLDERCICASCADPVDYTNPDSGSGKAG